jgi:hypothetical protein
MTCLGGKALCISVILTLGFLLPVSTAQVSSDFKSNIDSSSPNESDTPIILGGVVVLHWTAPGDDGNTGRAMGYVVRCQLAVDGPIDSETKWNQARPIDDEPQPSLPGQPDSITVNGLSPSFAYYFAIKTYDDAGNYSGVSNSPLIVPSLPIQAFSIGDVNNSGDISGLDLVFLVNALRGRTEIPTPDQRADVNGDCKVNSLDIYYLRAFLDGGPALIPGKCIQENIQVSRIKQKPANDNSKVG